MNHSNEFQNVTRHYHTPDLVEKIETALAKQHLTFSSLELKDLGNLDDLHIGGKAASSSLAKKAGLKAGELVLDVGSGIGGPARTLANDFQWQVIGLDLTNSFCHLANKLSIGIGIDNSLGFVNGNALKLPFKQHSIDAVWSQHCAMNILEKSNLYSEFGMVLKPGGKLLIHDIVSGEQEPVLFPVPWASSEDYSFLESASSLRTILEKSGFDILLWEDITEQSLAWFDIQKKTQSPPKPPILSQRLILGDNLKTMAKNVKANLQQNRIKVIEAICVPKKTI